MELRLTFSRFGGSGLSSGTVPADSPTPGGAASARSRALSSLRHREFRFLILSTMALQVGSWVQTIGLGWLVLQDLGGNATSLALVALLRGGSMLLMSPFGGYLGGRFERRRQLLVYTSISALIAAGLAVLIGAGAIELWMVYVASVGAGAVEALAGPTRSMLVYDSVDEADLTNAVALNALGGNAMRVIGPAIGGALIGIAGTQGAFEAQAVCLLASVALTFKLSRSKQEGGTGEGMFRSMGAGLAYVVRDRRMLVIVAMALLPSVMVYPYVSFLPMFARDVLGSDQTGYGYLAASVGLGSLVGGAAVALQGEGRGMGPRMVWACLIYTLCVLAFAFTRSLWLALVALALAGVFHSVYSALNASLMQLKADPEYRGRVLSLQTMTWGTTPFAALLMGRMIDWWNAPHVVAGWMAVAALLTLAIAIGSRELKRV